MKRLLHEFVLPVRQPDLAAADNTIIAVGELVDQGGHAWTGECAAALPDVIRIDDPGPLG